MTRLGEATLPQLEALRAARERRCHMQQAASLAAGAKLDQRMMRFFSVVHLGLIDSFAASPECQALISGEKMGRRDLSPNLINTAWKTLL